MLQKLKSLVEELSTTNSNNEKIKILKKHGEVKKLLQYIYDDNFIFGITSDNIRKLFNEVENVECSFTIIELLEQLNQRKYTGHSAVSIVKAFIKNNHEYEDLIYKIIDKDLRVRISTKIVNKAYTDCINEFRVSLAEDISSLTTPPDFDKECWYASRKLDGLRCVCLIDSQGNVEVMSRSGKQFKTLQVLKDKIKQCCSETNIVFDGEVCIIDDKGNENFNEIMKLYNKKDFVIPHPAYRIFDCIPYDDFMRGYYNKKFSERYNYLQNVIKNQTCYIKILPQIKLTNKVYDDMKNKIINDTSWEGLILRKDCEYEGKRSKNMLKVKLFKDEEFEVIKTTNNKIQYVDQITGLPVEEDMLSYITIPYKNNTVDVGSGFTIEQRKLYKQYPELILNKTVTIKYFSESTNEEGKFSLRFPTFKCVHGEKRQV